VADLIAFDQQLWRTLRHRATKGAIIDKLFSIPTNILQMFNVSVIKAAPLAWTLAAICWFAPFAAIFPLGALEVVGRLSILEGVENVPTLNLQMDTTSVLAELTGLAVKCYSTAAQPLRRSTARTILDHAVVTFPSPCGANRSYHLTFTGPAFECHNATNDLDNLDNASITNSMFINAVRNSNVFWLYYTPNTLAANRYSGPGVTQAVACRVYQSEYDFNMTFTNGNLVIQGTTKREQLLDWNLLGSSCTGAPRGPWPWNLTNMAAIADSVMFLLTGNFSTTSNL
jgi:hypothetical protein